MRLVVVPKNCRSQIAAPNSSVCISYRCRKDKGHFCQSFRSDEKATRPHITLRTRGRQAPKFILCGFPAKGDARCSIPLRRDDMYRVIVMCGIAREASQLDS